jgi:hypothetical protein
MSAFPTRVALRRIEHPATENSRHQKPNQR